jgi:hypothetical protein
MNNLRSRAYWVNQVELSKVCVFIYVHSNIKRKMMITYLKMLPSSLERDDAMWWRVDDFRWSFSSLHLELFMNILSPMLHSFLILLLCHLFIPSFVDLVILLGLLHILLFLLCNGLVDNTYPKEYTNASKQG